MDSKTILICDDDPTVRSSLSLVLKRAGYGIATAETPEQAVAQIRTTIPGLILMDMNYTRSTTGEEGLELLAKVKVNLGGISLSLFESEMFGHKKGAFTDAHYDRKGRFELADGGSIFLDEIGDLDMVSQVKLLRVLQDHTFESLGDSRPKQVDTRIICATNRNLPQMVQQGEFREDLFYRINLITVQMPALRERREDIPLLVEYFARQQARQNGLEPVEISAEAMEYLSRLPYPGNVRELKNFVERTILVSQQPHLTEVDFKNQYVEIAAKTGVHDTSVHSLEEIEKQMILRALELYGGNLSKVATALGLSRQAVYRRLEKYAIRPPE